MKKKYKFSVRNVLTVLVALMLFGTIKDEITGPTALEIITTIIFIGGITYAFYKLAGIPGMIKKIKNPSFSSTKVPGLSPKKEEHYKEMGLSKQETDFFRTTMADVKPQITHLETNIMEVPKLRAIDLNTELLIACKGIFKELVKNPRKLHKAEDFLYTHLPNIIDLTDKYIEIEKHDIKSKSAYDKLDESAQVIYGVAKMIVLDYEELVADDFEDMDVEISLAKQSLKHENVHKTDNNSSQKDEEKGEE